MTRVESLSCRPTLQRRVLAVSLLMVGVALIWGAVIEPLGWILVSQSQWRTDVRRELARARGRADSEPALRQRLEALPAARVWGKFFAVPKGQDVGALVQRDVMAVGATAGVVVQAVTSIPRVEEAGLAGYGVRFTVSMTADQVRKFMDALRGNAHYLRVERLGVTAPQLQQPDQNASLTVTMEVYGYTRDDDSPGADSSGLRARSAS